MPHLLLAIAYVAGCTLACVLGAAFIFIHKIPFTNAKPLESRSFMATFMSISAGTLLYTSLVELVPEAQQNLKESKHFGSWNGLVFLFLFGVGVVLTMALNKLLMWLNPAGHNCACHHEPQQQDEQDPQAYSRASSVHFQRPRMMPNFADSWEEDRWKGRVEQRRAYGALNDKNGRQGSNRTREPCHADEADEVDSACERLQLVEEETAPMDLDEECDECGSCTVDMPECIQNGAQEEHCHGHGHGHHHHHHHHHHQSCGSSSSSEEVEVTPTTPLLPALPPPPERRQSTRLYTIGISTAITISLHKLPEGFIIFTTTAFYTNPTTGALIFLALTIHNLTEGLAIALPLFLATSNRLRAFFYAALLGGLTQPLGAILGYAVVCVGNPNRNLECRAQEPSTLHEKGPPGFELAFGTLFSFVSGMMFWVAADGLLPAAWSVAGRHEDGDRHAGKRAVSIGLVVGVSLMVFCHALME